MCNVIDEPSSVLGVGSMCGPYVYNQIYANTSIGFGEIGTQPILKES